MFAKRTDHLGCNLFGRQTFPSINLTVFVSVDPPTRASVAQPTVLVGLAVSVVVNVAVGLDSEVVIRPHINAFVAVSVDKTAKKRPFGADHFPPRLARFVDSYDLAAVEVSLFNGFINGIRLNRFQ
ncbi:hypothetical protein CGZ80_06175 [Rhodopirellula sp. MGV]|nr:hypothetical protein CGZ80_06175 [Rhodopirellula sp. MGV]